MRSPTRWRPKTEPGTHQANSEMVSTNTIICIIRGSTNFYISGSLSSILFLGSFFCFAFIHIELKFHSAPGARYFLRFGVPELLHCVNFSPRLRGNPSFHFLRKVFFCPVLTKTVSGQFFYSAFTKVLSLAFL